ncbi:MAG: hypothetical protein JW969_05010 [Spirochaetales bacterium]|nr:hypothetical protein [Spirochaetales bacterium]
MNFRSLFKKLFSNLPAKVLALTAALLLFAFNRMNNLEERTFYTSLNLYLANGFAVAAPYQDKVAIKVRGDKEADVFKILEQDIEAFADLSNLRSEGEFKVPIQYRKISKSLNIEPLSIEVEPPEVKISIQRAETKLVDVKVNMKDISYMGVQMDYTYDPKKVHIYGPRYIVEPVESIATEEIDFSGRMGSVDLKAKLVLPSDFIRIKETATVDIAANIVEIEEERNFDSVEIEVRNLKNFLGIKNTRLNGNIRIKAPRTALESTDPSAFKLFINCSQIRTSGVYVVNVDYKVPDGFTVIQYEPSQLNIKVVALSEEGL